MRFINQAAGNLSNLLIGGSSSSNKNSAKITNCDNSSDISDSIESINETTTINKRNSSVMNDNFNNWTINSRHDVAIVNGLMKLNKKAFTVLCEPTESENIETQDFSQAPSSR